MAFRKNRTVRPLSADELERVKQDPRVQKMLTAHAALRPPLH